LEWQYKRIHPVKEHAQWQPKNANPDQQTYPAEHLLPSCWSEQLSSVLSLSRLQVGQKESLVHLFFDRELFGKANQSMNPKTAASSPPTMPTAII
jgi:hypothetical protein